MRGKCQLCEREDNLHRHHAKPKKFKKSLVNNEMLFCRDCDKQVHALFRLKDLRDKYNTPDKLLAHPAIMKYVEWVKDKPLGIVKHPKRTWKGGPFE